MVLQLKNQSNKNKNIQHKIHNYERSAIAKAMDRSTIGGRKEGLL